MYVCCIELRQGFGDFYEVDVWVVFRTGVVLFGVWLWECGYFLTYVECRLLARYGVCFQSKRISIDELWLVSLWVCAL